MVEEKISQKLRLKNIDETNFFFFLRNKTKWTDE